MFNSPYPNFVNVRSEGNCKCSVLISGTEFELSANYNTDNNNNHNYYIIIISSSSSSNSIIINNNNFKVGIGAILCTG